MNGHAHFGISYKDLKGKVTKGTTGMHSPTIPHMEALVVIEMSFI